jgi:hypothetical protein
MRLPRWRFAAPFVGGGSSDGRRRGRRLAQANRAPEDAANARFAAQADLAVHQVRQPTADRQAQPAAAVLSGRQAVGLLEGFEQACLVGRRNADAGILDFTAQAQCVAGLFAERDAHRHRPGGRELDGVAGEIEQNLAEPQIVAENRVLGQRGRDVHPQGDALGAGQRLRQATQLRQQRAERKTATV